MGPARPDGHAGTFVPLAPDAAVAFTRDYQLDPLAGRRVTWEIEALDEAPPIRRTDGATAAGLRAALRWVRTLCAIVPLAVAERDPQATLGHNAPTAVNAFAEPYQVGDANYGWSARDACYAFASYALDPDEALVITHRPPPCRFWNLVVWNPFMATEAVTDARTSINNGAAVPNADGSVTVVVARDRLAHPERGLDVRPRRRGAGAALVPGRAGPDPARRRMVGPRTRPPHRHSPPRCLSARPSVVVGVVELPGGSDVVCRSVRQADGGAGAGERRAVHGHPRPGGRERGRPLDPGRAGPEPVRPPVGRHHLRPDARRVPPARRPGRRPAGPAAHPRRRARPVRGGVADRGPGRIAGDAGGVAGRAGHGGGAGGARGAVDPDHDVRRGPGPHQGARRLRRRVRHRGVVRRDRERCAHHRARLGVGVPRQRAHRRGAGRPRAVADPRRAPRRAGRRPTSSAP